MTRVLAFICLICISPKCLLLYTTAKEYGEQTLKVVHIKLQYPCKTIFCNHSVVITMHVLFERLKYHIAK